jgi:hypothetical protein
MFSFVALGLLSRFNPMWANLLRSTIPLLTFTSKLSMLSSSIFGRGQRHCQALANTNDIRHVESCTTDRILRNRIEAAFLESAVAKPPACAAKEHHRANITISPTDEMLGFGKQRLHTCWLTLRHYV